MPDTLAAAIRGIRKRLGKSMAEFAPMIGCKQSTISRYEAGKLVPGRAVLILLLQFAEVSERQPVLDALGVNASAARDWDEYALVDALKTFEDYLETSQGGSQERAGAPNTYSTLAAFAKTAKQIVLQGSGVEPALVTILQHWIRHRRDPKAHQFFRHVAAYLDVELAVLKASRSKPPTA